MPERIPEPASSLILEEPEKQKQLPSKLQWSFVSHTLSTLYYPYSQACSTLFPAMPTSVLKSFDLFVNRQEITTEMCQCRQPLHILQGKVHFQLIDFFWRTCQYFPHLFFKRKIFFFPCTEMLYSTLLFTKITRLEYYSQDNSLTSKFISFSTNFPRE